tara:strand:+ start:433 stop:816 length:384 start_codon:yes stop_codon:yes gene_type:complete
MSDDFNTPRALAQLHALAKQVNLWCSQIRTKVKPQFRQKLLSAFGEMTEIFNILKEDPRSFVKQNKMAVLEDLGVREQDILAAIKVRDDARQKKDWKRSDEIRDELSAKGIFLMDLGDETVWRVSGE